MVNHLKIKPKIRAFSKNMKGRFRSKNKIFFVITSVFFLCLNALGAANYEAVQSGNWNDPNTWGAASFPNSSADNVAINDYEVAVNSADAVANNITIGYNGTLSFATANSLTVNGDLTVQGEFDASSSATITLKRAFENTGTLSNFSSANLTFAGSSTFTTTLPKDISTINSLIVNRTHNDGKLTIDTNLTVQSDLFCDDGEFNIQRNALTINGNIRINGDAVFTNDSGSTVNLGGSLFYASDINQSLHSQSELITTASSSFSSSGEGVLTVGDLTVNSSSTLTIVDSLKIAGDIDNSGNFDASAATIIFDNDANWIYPKSISSSSSLTFSNIKVAANSAVSDSADILLKSASDFSFVVEGDGSFRCASGTITIGETGASGGLDIDVSDNGDLRFGDVIISDLSLQVASASDFRITGDLNVGASASFTATNPSLITFSNDETSSTAKRIIVPGSAENLKFHDFSVNRNSAVKTTNSFDLTGDFTVNTNGYFAASGSSTISFIEAGNKSISNSSVLIFKHLTFGSAASGDNFVTTMSNFQVDGELYAQGNDANPENGGFAAYSPSVVTLNSNATTPSSDEISGGDALKFQGLKISSSSNITTGDNFQVKGDFINDGTFTATSGTITLTGDDEQLISGNAATFSTLKLNNQAGVKLEAGLFFDDYLTLNLGDVNLNGSSTITMLKSSSRLIESAGNTIKNETPGAGGTSGGFIKSAFITNKADVENAGLGLAISSGNSGSFTIRRYHSSRTIGEVHGVERYYRVDYENANLGDVGFTLDNSELNEAKPNALALYYSDADNSTSWTRLSSTFTYNEGVSTSSMTATGLNGLGSPIYLTLAPIRATVQSLPASGIDSLNEAAESPLVAGKSDRIIFGFGINTPTSINNIDSLKISVSSATYSEQFENYEFKYDSDRDLTTAGLSSASSSVSYSGGVLSIESISPSNLSAGDNYFFVLADVSSTVSSSSSPVSLTFSDSDLYLSSAETNTFTLSGSSYSFTDFQVTASESNTFGGNLTTSATLTRQPVFSFALTPPASAPTTTFTAVDIYLTSSSYTHFTDFRLWNDKNKNGYYDGADVSLGSSSTLTASSGTVTFSGFSNTFTEAQDYLFTCKVSPSAQTYSNIQAKIFDEGWVTVTSPASVAPFSSTLSGELMTVSSSTIPTKLSIESVEMTTPVSGFSDNEFISGFPLSIVVEAQDASGSPQGVTSDTDVTFTISAGSATVTNNSATISQYNSFVSANSVTLTNPDGATGIAITASTASLTSATYTGITLYAQEPTTAPSSLTFTQVTQTSATLSWSAGTPANHILIAKQGGEPDAPTRGTSYTASSTFSNPSGSTGTGSYVVYKGSGTRATVTGLTAAKRYYFSVYNYNGAGGGIRYKLYGDDGDMITLADTTTLSTEPTTQVSSLSVSSPQDTSMKLSWTNGAGSKRLIIARLNSPVSTAPTDGEEYQTSANFGEGDQIADGFVVYAGSSSSVTVKNLSPSSDAGDNTYYFAAYEYNDAGGYENYLTSSSTTASRKTLFAEPKIQASDITFVSGPSGGGYYADDNSIALSWKNGDGDGRIAVCSTTMTQSEKPSDATAEYSETPSVAGATVQLGTTESIGSGFIVYKGSDETNSVVVNGLTRGRRYIFQVFEYNGSGAAASTSQVNYLTDSANDNPNSKICDKYEPNNTADSLEYWQYVKTDGTVYSGVLSDTSDEDWFYFEPNCAAGENNIKIELYNLPENYELDLYNYTGSRLLRRSFNQQLTNETIILNNVPNSRYYIRIYTRYNNASYSPYRFKVKGASSRLRSITR